MLLIFMRFIEESLFWYIYMDFLISKRFDA